VPYRVLSQSTLSANRTATTHDANGNVGTRNAPAPNQTGTATVTTTYNYDALNRLTQKWYTDGSAAVDYVYDQGSLWGVNLTNPIGRLSLASADFGHVGTIMSYDAMGRVINQWGCTPTNCGTGSYSVPFAYDFMGNLTSTVSVNCAQCVPPTQAQITYTYDSAGRQTAISSSFVDSQHPGTLATVDSSAGYYPNGVLRKVMYGNGLTELQPTKIVYNRAVLT